MNQAEIQYIALCIISTFQLSKQREDHADMHQVPLSSFHERNLKSSGGNFPSTHVHVRRLHCGVVLAGFTNVSDILADHKKA